jgi:biopolymer transport protein ExbB
MILAVTDQIAILIQRGGWLMVPLLALSVVSLSLTIERAWFWLAFHRPGRLGMVERLTAALRKGDVKLARAIISGGRSPYAEVARRLLDEGATEAVAIEAIEGQRPRLDRFMVSLSTIITAAPLLGILGTVSGIIASFQLLGDQATLTDPRDVSAGIAEALLTTAFGLIVALITLFPYMIYRGQLDRAMGRMESIIAAAIGAENAKHQPRTARPDSAATAEPARGFDGAP